MAHPYIFASSFDTGDIGAWDTETDVSGVLDYPHYTTLVGLVGRPVPYRGAYAMRIVAPANTSDHTLLEGSIDIAAAARRWVRFMLYVSTNFSATATDIFNIFELQATTTIEVAVSLRITTGTNLVEIGVTSGAETEAATFSSPVSKGVWHQIELNCLIDSGAPNDGTTDFYMDGGLLRSVASLDQGAITDGVLGTQDTLATTDGGFLLFDEFAFDDTRAYITHRFATHRFMPAAAAFMFVGPGRIDNVKILDGGSGDVGMEIYDTDTYSSSLEPRWRGRTVTANTDVDAADVPIEFQRGCLAVLGGTTPGAQIAIGRATGWGSDGAIRAHAAKRTPAPGNL